ncbi:MAG: DNA polymerase III subunit delta [Verrucomicrobiota bacterium]|jgi:DNA polymerase III subunit delta
MPTLHPAPSPVHLVAGSDEFAIKEAATKLAESLAPKAAGEFGVEIIDGVAGNQDEALKILARINEALNTIGFFGVTKLVWLKNTNLLADDRAVTAEAVKEALTEFSEQLKRGLPSGVTLLISAIGFDKRRSLAKTLEKLATIQLFDAPEAGKRAGEEEISELVQTVLHKDGKRLMPAAYQAFREMVEPESRTLVNELEKVCLYVGARTDITESDVRAICSVSRGAGDFELTNALGDRNLPNAISAVELMFDRGEPGIRIVLQLVGQFRFMMLTKDLAQRKLLEAMDGYGGGEKYFAGWNRLPEDAKAHFPRTKEGGAPNPWRLYRCALAARNFSIAELIRALELLQEANRQLVTTQLDDRLIVEEAVTKIARK